VAITSSPELRIASNAEEIAAIPEAATTAASACSSCASLVSATVSVGLPYRV